MSGASIAGTAGSPATAAVEFIRRFRRRHSSWVPTLAALVILVAMLLGAQAYFGNFLTPRVLSALLLDNAYLLVLAVGMTFVILTGGIDLSVGAVMAFTGMLGATMLASGLPTAVVVPAMLAIGAAMGLAVGVMVQYFDVQPFIASLAAMFAARGLAFMVSLSSVKVEDPAILWLQSTRIQGAPGSFYITPTGIIALLVVAAAALILHLTRFGRTIYAIGGNEQSARLMWPARRPHEAPGLRRVRRLLRAGGRDLHRVHGGGVPAERDRDRARHDRRGRHRRDAAHGWQRFRDRLDDRCARLRHDQVGHLLPRGGAVVDADLGGRAPARVRRGAARAGGPVCASAVKPRRGRAA
ncbi:hypothetical protein QE381_002342 [Microbacterium sp. SORGH_AS 888]|nr:hypothetical protein [Microbacterium sp. SORGH_AS_0888]